MKKSIKAMAAFLLAAGVALAVTGCGSGDGAGYADGGQAQSSAVSVKTGSIAADSWGYTGSTAVTLSAPSQTAVVVGARSLLLDGSRAVVSGTLATEVRYSSDITSLSTTAQAAAPANFVSYLAVAIESVQQVSPALSVNVDAGTVPAGESVSIYSYDTAARKWSPVQAAAVGSTGKVSFTTTKPGLYGLFK